MKLVAHAGILALTIAGSASAADISPVASASDTQVRQLYEAEAAWREREYGGLGDDRISTKAYLAHLDAATQRRRLAYWKDKLNVLNSIPAEQLKTERINAAIFRQVLKAYISQQEFRDYEAPFSSSISFWAYLAARNGLANAAEYRDYISRMREIPRYFGEQIENMQMGLRRGFTPPRVSIVGRETSIVPFENRDAEKNPFFAPFLEIPPNISAVERAALTSEAKAVISDIVAPAYVNLYSFIKDDYIPNARGTVAAESLPEGKAYYAAKVQEYTTTDLTPEQIHALGEREVSRIDADMRRTMAQAGWKGSFEDFLKFLKTDPQFYAKTPYELIARATYIANQIYGQLRYAFDVLPRFRFSVLPTPPAVALFAPGGNGGRDSCVINTYNLPSRPLYTLPALVLHECVPGHTFQNTIGMESRQKPSAKKGSYFAATSEGWGLYSEWLGEDMHIYSTPYEEFGRESYEMWRAARLVVDTGIHHMGWSRQRAIDYLSAHTALSQAEITSEVDRYISWPAQALGYKLGEMAMRRKRLEAEAALGQKFDLRWFNDKLIRVGGVPLPALEQEMDTWIAEGGPNPNK